MHVRFYEFSKLFSLVNKSTNHTQYSDIVTGKIQKGKVSKFDIFHPRSLQSRRNFLALLKRYLLQYEREIKSNGFFRIIGVVKSSSSVVSRRPFISRHFNVAVRWYRINRRYDLQESNESLLVISFQRSALSLKYGSCLHPCSATFLHLPARDILYPSPHRLNSQVSRESSLPVPLEHSRNVRSAGRS